MLLLLLLCPAAAADWNSLLSFSPDVTKHNRRSKARGHWLQRGWRGRQKYGIIMKNSSRFNTKFSLPIVNCLVYIYISPIVCDINNTKQPVSSCRLFISINITKIITVRRTKKKNGNIFLSFRFCCFHNLQHIRRSRWETWGISPSKKKRKWWVC